MAERRAIRIGNWFVKVPDIALAEAFGIIDKPSVPRISRSLQVSSRLLTFLRKSSGFGGDGPDQLFRQATEGPIDALFADYLAEVNIAHRAIEVCPGLEIIEVPKNRGL